MNLKKVYDGLAVNGRLAKALRQAALQARIQERAMQNGDGYKETAGVDSKVASITTDTARSLNKAQQLRAAVLTAADKLQRTGGTVKADNGKNVFTFFPYELHPTTGVPIPPTDPVRLSQAAGRKVMGLFSGIPNGGALPDMVAGILAERLADAIPSSGDGIFELGAESARYGLRKEWTDKDGQPRVAGKVLTVSVREDGAFRVQIQDMYGKAPSPNGEEVWSQVGLLDEEADVDVRTPALR